MGLKLRVPKLTLIIERTIYANKEDWLKSVQSFLPILKQHSSFAIQLRSVGPHAKTDRMWIDQRIPIHPMIRLNGSIETQRSIHLPERMLQKTHRQFSASVHNHKAIAQATDRGASYLHIGPIYSPTSKSTPFLGEKQFKTLLQSCTLPVVAVGGINANNVLQPFELGASGVAVIGSVLLNPKPLEACSKILDKISLFKHSS